MRENTSRFGEPGPKLPTLFLLAICEIAEATRAGVLNGEPVRYSAATPATCGAAIEVPLIVLVAVLLPIQSEIMSTPGANRSTQAPKLENSGRWSAEFVAPTVIAVGVLAGENPHASASELPAATV